MRIQKYILTAVVTVLAAGSALAQQTSLQFAGSPGQKLMLDIQTGASVQVHGSGISGVEVTYDDRGRGIEIEFNETADGLEIVTYFRDSDEEDSRFRNRNRSSHLKFEVRVPAEFDIELDSMGGSLTIIDVEGHFSGKTMGGALTLENVLGEARLTTMGGRIQLTDSELDGSLKTMGGEVLFRNVVGTVKGTSMGGNVRYENVRRSDGEISSPKGTSVDGATADTVQISTMGGRIDVDDAPAGASVSTMGGNIRIERVSRFVKAKTMGGDIFIDEVNGWVQATTMGGDVDVTVIGLGDSEKGVSLTSMSGDVTLTVPAGLSMEFDLSIAYTRNSDQNYRIVSDFGIRQEQDTEWDFRHGSPRKYLYGTGSVGGGRHLVKIETVNGNIRIRKGR